MGPLNRNEIGKLPVGFFAALALSLLLVACDRDSRSDGGAQPQTGNGAQIFADNCSACHGEGGRAPGLDQIRSLSAEERSARLRMHPIAGTIPQRLTANELAGVIGFLESADPGTPPEPSDDFLRQCNACHGGGRGPALTELMGLSRPEIKDRLSNHPVAGDLTQRFKAHELGALREYLDAD